MRRGDCGIILVQVATVKVGLEQTHSVAFLGSISAIAGFLRIGLKEPECSTVYGMVNVKDG